jgi:hypothetical protein
VTLLVALALVVLAAALGVSALLLVRRRAPEGSYFADGDRAAGVFGVLATGFSVLLGFVIFLAFTSYDDTKRGAETEAELVAQQFVVAQFLPAAPARRLGDELTCYARYVVGREWPTLADGDRPAEVNPWGVAQYRTLRAARPESPSAQAAFSKLLDQTTDRQTARQDRLHAAEGVVPLPLWLVLILTAVVIVGFMLFFADSGERAIVQATLIGSVICVVSAMLLLLGFLDNPYRAGPGSLQPTAMERTLGILATQREIVGSTGPLPCNDAGDPVG